MTRSSTIVGVILLAGTIGCMALENRLLFHPVRPKSQAAPTGAEDVALRSADGVAIGARWWPHAQAHSAILYCPGNAGNLDLRADLVRELRDRLGLSVLIFDYYDRLSAFLRAAGID